MVEPGKIELTFGKKPVLKNIFDTHGSKSLSQYENESVTRVKNSGIFNKSQDRKQEFFESYKSIVSNILGQEIAQLSIDELEKNSLVSTADHQGVLSHPFFLSTTLIRSWNTKKRGSNTILTFPCAGVSLSNSSYPRSIAFHANNGEQVKIHFKSLKYRRTPVYVAPKIDSKDTKNIIEQINKLLIDKEQKQKIKTILNDQLINDKFTTLEDYDSQMSFLNYHLWKQIPGEFSTNLIYISEEKISVKLLLDHHINKDSILNQLLFNPAMTKLFDTIFYGIDGSHNNESGTFLFWLTENNERVSLMYQDGNLSTRDNKKNIKLDTETIQKYLKEKRLMPSMAFCLIILSFYYKITCGGGFSQVNYLQNMKTAWETLLSQMDHENEVEIVKNSITDIYLGDYNLMTESYGQPHLFDCMLNFSDKEILKYKSLADSRTLHDDILSMMPFFYSTL